MPSGVGGGILSNPPVKPDEGALWVFVNGAWQQTHTITAPVAFDITGSAGAANLPTPIFPSGTPLSFVGAVTNIMEGVAWLGQGWRLIGRLAGGSRGADAATPNSAQLITVQGYGHDGTAWQASPNGHYSIVTDGLWSGSNRGVYHGWFATTNGTTSEAEHMRLQGGNLLVGTTTNLAGTGGLSLAGTTDTSGAATGAFQCAGGGAFAKSLTIGSTAGNFLNIANSTGALKINGTQVVKSQITGYGTPTGGANQGSFAAGSITLANLAAGVAQLILDLKTHGLLGT